jgi:type IV pilus assembly protein PilC
MQAFRYKAVSKNGKAISGVIEAYDEFEAIEKIRPDCRVVTEVQPVTASRLSGLMNVEIGGKITTRDLSIMCSQFSIILRAGMPLGRAIGMIARQTSNKKLRDILTAVSDDVMAGHSLAQSFEDEAGELLPETFYETIRAGEQSGNVDKSFFRMQTYYENSNKLRAKVVTALMSPMFTLIVAIVVVAILMIKVVPGFTANFQALGTDLPAMTKALIAISTFFGKWWLLMVAILLMILILTRAYAVSPEGRLKMARGQLSMPLVGNMLTLSAASEFATTMSTMLASGLTILQAVKVTGRSMSNAFAGQATEHLADGIEQGRSLGSCLQECTFYPEILREMTNVGEQTGSLEETLETIGNYYSGEAEYATAKVVGLLEPITLCVVAVIAGFIVIAMYMAMFSMYGAM